ncbi:MAG: hypothetical protein KKG47_11155 [Proteobacteria bacterium]|nr:hypothetical protein [Pseudomonadota bacterium]MBU1736803.1 hypothetical protein [Pseudomonadota bacterium]
MKILLPVVTIAALIVAGVCAYYLPGFDRWLVANNALLNSLSVLGVVGLIVFLSLSISFFEASQAGQRKDRANALGSRLAVLAAELNMNHDICTRSFSEFYSKYIRTKGLPVPESRFQTTIIEKTISSGDITETEFLLQLWNLYRSMSLTNTLLNNAVTVRNTGHIADPENKALNEGRIVQVDNNVKGAMSTALQTEKLFPEVISRVESIMETIRK